MKKIVNKTIFGTLCVLALFLTICSPSSAAYCNSPCPNPCSPSRTVCEGASCTTYCGSTSIYNASYYTSPSVSFSYSTPNVSFSISNEVYGLHNVYPRRLVVTNGFRPVYHKTPSKRPPVVHHKPKPKPGHKPALNHKPSHKPAPHKHL